MIAKFVITPILAALIAWGAIAPTKAETPKALTFAITVYRSGSKIALHYPKADNVHWIEVCVVTNGKVNDKFSPGNYTEWTETVCWPPRFGLEDFPLRVGALKVTASLVIKEGETKETLIVRAQVRPEPTDVEPNGNGPGEEQ